MINISVDEGYAYDFFSILGVKFLRGLVSLDVVQDCYFSIEQQVGSELHAKIVASEEYTRLLNLNDDTFDAVNRAKIDTIRASEVHELNHQRYLAKKALQEKFFPESKQTEAKN